jgi:hypothetical protein
MANRGQPQEQRRRIILDAEDMPAAPDASVDIRTPGSAAAALPGNAAR